MFGEALKKSEGESFQLVNSKNDFIAEEPIQYFELAENEF